MRESKIEVGQKYLLDLELHSNPIKVRVLDKSPTISGSLSEGNLSIGGIFRVQCLKTGKTYWTHADKLAPLLQNQRMKDFKSSLKSLTDAVFAAGGRVRYVKYLPLMIEKEIEREFFENPGKSFYEAITRAKENKTSQDAQAPTREQVTDFMKELDNDPYVVKLGDDSESNPEPTTWTPQPGERCLLDTGTPHHIHVKVIKEKYGTYQVVDTWTGDFYDVEKQKLKPLRKNKTPLTKAVEELIENGPALDQSQFKKGTFKSGGIATGPTMGKEPGGELVIPCTLHVKPKPHTNDTVVRDVRKDLKRRSKAGIEKYGTTLDREDLSLKEWLQHAYEECLDQALYLKRAIRELNKPSGDELETKV